MHINLIGNIRGNESGKINMLLSSGQPRESII